ncbi:hypothetical protein ACFYMI_26260 [Streptomyces collinus]
MTQINRLEADLGLPAHLWSRRTRHGRETDRFRKRVAAAAQKIPG